MDIYILNKSLEKIGVIDMYKSIIWTRRYYSAGDFELYVPASVEMFSLLQKDYYLQRDDDDGAMIIEDIELQTDAELGDHIIVAGRSVESILLRRVVWQQTILNGTAENAIRKVITENCINPLQAGRAITRLQLAPASGFIETIEQQITGDNVGEWLETVCRKYGYGWKINIENGYFVFYLYKGKDRTYGNAEGNPFVVFSPDFDNLINSNYRYSKREYKNAALIMGEGEGLERVNTSVGEAEDLDRYEIYIDARDISSNNGEIPAAEYLNMLTERGNQQIAEQAAIEEFDGETDASGVYQYKRDFEIGDTVQIENEYGVTSTTRIIEIIENEDESGQRIVPTFEKWDFPRVILRDASGYILRDKDGAILTIRG